MQRVENYFEKYLDEDNEYLGFDKRNVFMNVESKEIQYSKYKEKEITNQREYNLYGTNNNSNNKESLIIENIIMDIDHFFN